MQLETVNTRLGDDAGHYVALMSWEARLPSREQWAAGTRRDPCDAVYGVDAPRVAPGRMAGALKGPRATDYRACYDGTPTTTTSSPCSTPHTAEIIAVGQDLPDDVALPTQDRTRQAMAEATSGRALDEIFSPSPRPTGLLARPLPGLRGHRPRNVSAACSTGSTEGRARWSPCPERPDVALP